MQFLRLLSRAVGLWFSREADIHAAALAYFMPFALPPLVLLSITIVGLLIGVDEVSALLISWGNSIDPEITALLDSSVRNFSTITTAYVIPIIAVLFFSTMIIVSLNLVSSALHKIWNIENASWKTLAARTVRSFLFVLLLQAYLVWIILLNRTITFIGHIPIGQLVSELYPILLFISTVLLITISYGLLPTKAPRFKARLYGALVASVMFFFTRELVALHTSTSPISDVFGAAGLLIVLLVWIYLSASIVLYGAAFAGVYDEERRKRITK